MKWCPTHAMVLSTLFGSITGVTAPAPRFPFVIPGDDSTASATNMSHLSATPAGEDGFVTIRDGHFHTDSGRLRIWGVNTCFGGNFPDHGTAEKAAAHLAKLGVNAVRMHHHDTRGAPAGIWGDVIDGQRQFDPDQLDRQDYFLAQLHRNGIYANLNLHVSRTFAEAEGFLSKDLPRTVRYNKYLLYYEPRMRERFKAFCRDYLTHDNPYRRCRRVDDPAIAMLEITNENAFSTKGPGIAASLPEPYRGEFKRQWNVWLRRRYPGTASLLRAWQAGAEPLSGDVAAVGDVGSSLGRWRLRQAEEGHVAAIHGAPGPTEGVTALHLDIRKPCAEIFRQELTLGDLSLVAGKLYTISFWIRSEAERTLYADVSNQGPGNWRSLGYGKTIRLTSEWLKIEDVFRARESVKGNARICFKFGGDSHDLYLAGIRLRHGGTLIVLPPGQSVENGDVEIPVGGWADKARDDARAFMVETEEGFIREIMAYLKDDLGVNVPITASQVNYHGPGIVAATCDYADVHAYWQHPRFPGKPWDRGNWSIRNTPMEQAPGRDALLSRASLRLLDRPYTLSEWNIPDPSDYGASVVPFAGLVAGLQDWDGVFFFQYQSSDKGWFGDAVSGYFSFNGQPAKLVLLTAFASMFRRGDLPPLEQVLATPLGIRVPSELAMRRRLGIDTALTAANVPEATGSAKLETPDRAATWDATNPASAHVRLITPASRAVWGLVAGRQFRLGDLSLEVGETERDYAAIIFTSLDGLPLRAAKRILLAAVGSAQNLDMEWDETRTSVGRNWGRGPTQVNGIPLVFELTGGDRQIFALDGTGQHAQAVPTTFADGRCRAEVGPEYRTLWYEILSP